METEQNQTPAPDAEQKQSLKDFTADELYQIYRDRHCSYQYTAGFIENYYNINTSRQAVYKRLKPYLAKKAENEITIRNRAEEILLEAMNQGNDLKLKVNAARIVLAANKNVVYGKPWETGNIH